MNPPTPSFQLQPWARPIRIIIAIIFGLLGFRFIYVFYYVDLTYADLWVIAYLSSIGGFFIGAYFYVTYKWEQQIKNFIGRKLLYLEVLALKNHIETGDTAFLEAVHKVLWDDM